MDKKEDKIYSCNQPIEDKNAIKRGMKKIIKKSTAFLLNPFIQYQNEVNEELWKKVQDNGEKNIQQDEEISKLHDENTLLKKHLEKLQADLGAVSRQLMAVKWKQIDENRHFVEKDDDILTCDICGHSAMRKTYETKEADCIFNGGHLVRYVCPECGVVFGPSKFEALGQEGIDEDYWVHYLGFQEGNSCDKEIRAFMMLHPNKESLYLNYGCGCWSKSMEKLRADGYQVYGYEPYAADIDNPYMITGKDRISTMKFDGIFSNDLLEHLTNPIEDLKFMKSLLLRPESKMAHATGCFAYAHEVTRFHTHFFTGKSADILAQKAGFEIVERCDDLEENDFICCVFEMKDKQVEYIERMAFSEEAFREGKEIVLKPGSFCFGPYISLGAGKYNLILELEGETVKCELRLTSKMGQNLIHTYSIDNENKAIELELTSTEEKVEFVITNQGIKDIRLKSIVMK